MRPRRTGDRVLNSSLGSGLRPHVDRSHQRSGTANGVTAHTQFSFGVHTAESVFADSRTSEWGRCRRCDPLIGLWLRGVRSRDRSTWATDTGQLRGGGLSLAGFARSWCRHGVTQAPAGELMEVEGVTPSRGQVGPGSPIGADSRSILAQPTGRSRIPSIPSPRPIRRAEFTALRNTNHGWRA